MYKLISLLSLLIPVLLLTACDDDSTGPSTDVAMLAGRVTEASGDPVADARIVIAFGIDDVGFGEEWGPSRRSLVAKVLIKYDLPAPGNVRVEVQDLDGARVRLLHDAPVGAESLKVAWDWADADGVPLPCGVYRFVLDYRAADGAIEDDHLEELFLMYTPDVEGLYERPQTHTGPDGRFEVPLASLPIGVTIDDDPPESLGVDALVVSQRVRVLAFREGEPLTPVATVVDILDLESDLIVDLTF